jgi:hypothetical protein
MRSMTRIGIEYHAGDIGTIVDGRPFKELP